MYEYVYKVTIKNRYVYYIWINRFFFEIFEFHKFYDSKKIKYHFAISKTSYIIKLIETMKVEFLKIDINCKYLPTLLIYEANSNLLQRKRNIRKKNMKMFSSKKAQDFLNPFTNWRNLNRSKA